MEKIYIPPKHSLSIGMIHLQAIVFKGERIGQKNISVEVPDALKGI
jgi:hypothetical protein